MDNTQRLCERLEALERYVRRVEHRLRLWRIIACCLAIVGLVGLPLPTGTAQEKSSSREERGLAQRVEALEHKLVHITSSRNEVTVTGANQRIVNGLGSTDCEDERGNQIPYCPNGLGNLIVGYNELRNNSAFPDVRTGSHNIVVGKENNYSTFGGLVVGRFNEISGFFSSISGGQDNIASGLAASVSGGLSNRATNGYSSVSGGDNNEASAVFSSISGGFANRAIGNHAWIGGGDNNTASENGASVSGGLNNTASGETSSVSGGVDSMASGFGSSISGGIRNTASGADSSVSGGADNTASGLLSSVSGGSNRTAPGQFNWAAGPFLADN
jgi:hypothetical protein